MWKTIPDWENYEVNEDGEVRNKTSKRLITGDINNAGYYRICCYNKNNKKKFFRHRLVATLFLENPNNYQEVNHIDGNKSNNNVNNLEWCDRQHNERESRRIGIKKYKPFKVVFNNGQVKNYECAIDLATELGVSRRTVQNYLESKTKGYLKYNITEIEYI